jgi:hypothetical protein
MKYLECKKCQEVYDPEDWDNDNGLCGSCGLDEATK